MLLRLTGCADKPDPTGPYDSPREMDRTVPHTDAALSEGSFTFVGAADIASCSVSNRGDEATAAIINGLIQTDPGLTVFAAGDLAYNNATAAEFTNCYDPTWGQFKARTRPALGNHEYNVSTDPYFDYYNGVGSDSGSAGKRGFGYYSYDLGNWHIIVLNSNTLTGATSAQNTWLKSDLAHTSQPCVLAYWHHARFASAVNSATNTLYAPVKPFWDALYAYKADVVLAGHQHFYERFAPQTPDGVADPQNGIRQFLVGAGGKSKGGAFQATAPNSEARTLGIYGVLKLTLKPSGYDWAFLAEAGQSFPDQGSGTCHSKNPAPVGMIAITNGNNQSATVNTAVVTRPEVRVTDANGLPAAGVVVTFAVATGGGSITGGTQTTNLNGNARVGKWTLGTLAGSRNNTLTATTAGLAGSPVAFTATGTPGPANADNSTATVPHGTVGSPTAISVQAKDQFDNNLASGGATVAVTVSGANSATPAVTDNADGTYSASYTPTTAGSDQVAITLDGTAISGSPYSSTVTGGGGTATTLALDAGNNQSATVNTAVATAPSVKVTDAGGNPVQGVAVTFAVASGAGSITGASQTTNAQGIATVGSWTLGTTAGSNTLTATSEGLTGSPVAFTATGTPGPANADNSTATVPHGTVGSPTAISVQAKDQFDNNLASGGATVAVTVSGANSATPAVTDNGNGSYSASYTPTTAGSDNVAITLNGTAISGSPYSSTVAGGAATTIAQNAGNNQSATVNTAVTTPPSVKVTDGSGNPVANVAVTFAVGSGGGSITGGSQTTNAEGIATVGSWILGTKTGGQTLTASSAGLAGSPVTFTATATAGAPMTMVIFQGNNQTAPAGTAVPTRPGVNVKDAFGNGVRGVTVIFNVATGGGSVTGASVVTGEAGSARVGSWILGTVPGTNTLTATASGSGIANNPITFTATGT
jgi:adhesin/invasin